MKRKALRVRSEGSIPTYVTEAESRKQHSDSPLCNSLTWLFFYSPRGEGKILRTYHFIPPKFHFILPKFYFVPTWALFIFHLGI